MYEQLFIMEEMWKDQNKEYDKINIQYRKYSNIFSKAFSIASRIK